MIRYCFSVLHNIQVNICAFITIHIIINKLTFFNIDDIINGDNIIKKRGDEMSTDGNGHSCCCIYLKSDYGKALFSHFLSYIGLSV